MGLISVSVQVPKELNDVRVALLGVIESVKAGKDAAQIILGNLEKLSEAIKNAQAIPDEFKANLKESAALSGLLGGEILGSLLGQPAAQDGDIVKDEVLGEPV